MGTPAPEGCMGQVWEGTSPRWVGAPPTRAQGEERREKGQTLGSDGPKAHLVVRPPLCPLGRPPRWDLGLAATPRGGNLGGGAAPPLPLYILEVWAAQHTRVPLLLGAALPLSLLVSCGAWRSPARVPRSSTTTTPLCCCWMESSSTSPSLLAGSRHRRRHRAVRVLNTEVSSVRH